MLFSPKPKKSLKDIFDREKEVTELRNSLDSPLVTVYGLRRMGKTSIIKAVLNDSNVPYLYLNMRKFESRSYISYKDFLKLLQDEVNSKIKSKRMEALKNFLRGITGVSIEGIKVYFSWKSERKVDFSSILDALNEWAESKGERLTIVIDEAQELIKLYGYTLLPSLAYAYDELEHLNFIITGSEVRVFSKFLKIEDPESPIYGRAIVKISLNPFDRDTSIKFLKEGFKEHGIDFKKAEEVYEELGGNPGWLTYYGYIAVKKGFQNAMKETKKIARKLLRQEFENFLMEGGRVGSRERYVKVIRTCKEGCSWSDVKLALETLEGREVNDYTVHKVISNLLDYSFLVKTDEKYKVADKLIVEALEGG